MNWLTKKILLEMEVGGVEAGESVGDSQIAGVSDKFQIFNNIVVKNPKGKAFKSANGGFGFGLASTPQTTAIVNDFVNQFLPDIEKFQNFEEDERFADTDEPELPNWQDVNKAVGNYVRMKLNTSLEPMQLGKVAQKPVSRYDGFDMKKIGAVTDKKFLKSLGLKIKNTK